MKNIILIGVAIVYGAALVFLFLRPKEEVKPVFNQTFPQVNATERVVETSTYDYSENFIVGTKLRLSPVSGGAHTILSKDIFDIWYDATTEALRAWDGNSSGGGQIPVGKFGYDQISINATTNDTVNFPDFFDEYVFSVDYIMTVDSVNSSDATITFQQTYHPDSTYETMSATVFPLTLQQHTERFVASTALKYSRAIVSIGTADTIAVDIQRRPRVGQ